MNGQWKKKDLKAFEIEIVQWRDNWLADFVIVCQRNVYKKYLTRQGQWPNNCKIQLRRTPPE